MPARPFLALLLMLCPALAAAQAPSACNQLGREIALRAAEQSEIDLDARRRAELAAIAEAACLDFQAAPDSDAAPAAAGAGDDDSGLLDFRYIEPEDRVQRPGLKRR